MLEIYFLSLRSYRVGVNIKDANNRTPIHATFRSSNNLNQSKSNPGQLFNIDADFGDKVFD